MGTLLSHVIIQEPEGVLIGGLCFPPMELNNKKLQTLIERAWSLHDKLNHEIDTSISFCRLCSDHGRYCDVGKQTPFEERDRLIAIRDSLKQVEHMLLQLQKLQSWQLLDRDSALSPLEQSRLFLIKQVSQYQGRSLDVLKELKACFGNESKTGFDINVKESVKRNGVESRRRRLSRFLICCVRVLFKPWKWHSAVGIAVKLILITASLSSTIQIYHAKQRFYRSISQRKLVSLVHPNEAEKIDNLLTISKIPLDVFCGKG